MPKKTISVALTLIIALSLVAFTSPPASAAGLTATPTASTVLVNGAKVAFDAYNISGNNYFKLRDMAYTLNGTAKQFEVGFSPANNAITLTSGATYTPAGGEMTGKGAGSKSPTPTSSKIYLDGRAVSFTAYNIDGNNYFKLRDLGETFNFGVDWDAARNTIVIDTTKGYTPEGGRSLTLGDYIDKSAPITTSTLIEYYNLTTAERTAYDQMIEGITKFEMQIQIQQISLDSFRKVTWLVKCTLPGIFWYSDSYHYAHINGMVYLVLPVYLIDNKKVSAEFNADATVRLPSSAAVEDGRAWISKTRDDIAGIINKKQIQGGMKPHELERFVHDWIGDITTYETVEEDIGQVRSLYDVMIHGRGNCVGYSKTFQFLMNQLGIECMYINGVNSTGVLHAWNAIKLDGEWYHVDVTSDDYSSEYYNKPVYYFYNCTDNKIVNDAGFTIGGDSYPAGINPNITCTSTRYAYSE